MLFIFTLRCPWYSYRGLSSPSRWVCRSIHGYRHWLKVSWMFTVIFFFVVIIVVNLGPLGARVSRRRTALLFSTCHGDAVTWFKILIFSLFQKWSVAKVYQLIEMLKAAFEFAKV